MSTPRSSHLRDAIRLAPDMPAAHNNLGNALGRKGDKPGALEQFRTAVRLAPNAAQAQSNLGRMLLEHGEPDEALCIAARPCTAPA